MTPPAFITMGTNGLWVGKFETGYKGATTTASAQVNSSDSAKVQIKPNVYSWRSIQIANSFLASYNYQRDLDSHMMKNTEWGAVAYLQHSKYGSATNVRINNNAAYITGYAAKVEGESKSESTSLGIDGTNTYNYKNSSSVVASTTGNYTGIYDMSGGNYEAMMGVMLDSASSAPLSGRNSTYHSNFNGTLYEGGSITGGTNFPNTRYFDRYAHSKLYTNFNQRILGDAIGESGPFTISVTQQFGSWYKNEAFYISSEGTWVYRGGTWSRGLYTSIFSFYHAGGQANNQFGFRIVLAI